MTITNQNSSKNESLLSVKINCPINGVRNCLPSGREFGEIIEYFDEEHLYNGRLVRISLPNKVTPFSD